MKWTEDRINKFKSDPLNQLAKRKPMAFLGILFLIVLGATMILCEVAGWQSTGWPKYLAAICAAGGGFLGTKLRWKATETAERNANN